MMIAIRKKGILRKNENAVSDIIVIGYGCDP